MNTDFFFPKSRPKRCNYGRIAELSNPVRKAERGKLSDKLDGLATYKGETNWALYNAAQIPGPGHHDVTQKWSQMGGIISKSSPKTEIEQVEYLSKQIPGRPVCN
jgi:hypothetical protein